MPATRRVSLPVHAWPEDALGATALLCPDVAMLGWACALSILRVAQCVTDARLVSASLFHCSWSIGHMHTIWQDWIAIAD